MSAFATLERFHCIPEDSLFDPIEKGYKWGEEFGYCWFKTDFVVPDGLGGKDIFIRPHISGYEGTLWVDGVPYGNFSTKIVFTGHGNHYCDLLKKDAKAGEKIAIDLEYYAGHSYKGCHPTENNPLLTYDSRTRASISASRTMLSRSSISICAPSFSSSRTCRRALSDARPL